MAVAWNNTTLNDKVKLPSVTELGGLNNTNALNNEGISYPFLPILYNNLSITKLWTRSLFLASNGYIWKYMYGRDIYDVSLYTEISRIVSIFRLS